MFEKSHKLTVHAEIPLSMLRKKSVPASADVTSGKELTADKISVAEKNLVNVNPFFLSSDASPLASYKPVGSLTDYLPASFRVEASQGCDQ
jgi:hypothetical protein